jgi:hypothetical protein
MTRADLNRILMNTELEEHRNLTREQARAAVNEIFGGKTLQRHNEKRSTLGGTSRDIVPGVREESESRALQ